jgi:hypothetical protein
MLASQSHTWTRGVTLVRSVKEVYLLLVYCKCRAAEDLTLRRFPAPVAALDLAKGGGGSIVQWLTLRDDRNRGQSPPGQVAVGRAFF